MRLSLLLAFGVLVSVVCAAVIEEVPATTCDAAEVLAWAKRAADIKLQTAVTVGPHNASGGCGLFASKPVPHANTILVRVRPAALIAEPKHGALVLRVAQLLAEVEAGNVSTPHHEHMEHVVSHWGRPGNATEIACPLRIPALVVNASTARACFAAHPRRLLKAAHDELKQLRVQGRTEVLARGATFKRRHLRAAWAVVRTRAIDGPVDVSAPDDTWTFLAPGVDLANMPSSGLPSDATTRLEFQRTQAAFRSALNDAGDDVDEEKLAAMPRPKRPTRLDVLLTSTRTIRKGAELTLAYGNIRHPLDALDTFGYVPRGSNGSVEWVGELPLQLGFPAPKARRHTGRHRVGRDAAVDVYDEHQCRNETVMTFDPATGRPSPSVVTCLVLVHIQQRPSDEASATLRKYLGGLLSRDERRKLTAVAWGLLQFHANRTAVEEYAPVAEEGAWSDGCREAVAVAVASATNADHPSAVRESIADVAAVTRFMREAYERLHEYAAAKARHLGEQTAPEHPPPSESAAEQAAAGDDVKSSEL